MSAARAECRTPQDCRQVVPAPQDSVNYELTQPQQRDRQRECLRELHAVPGAACAGRVVRERDQRADHRWRDCVQQSRLQRVPHQVDDDRQSPDAALSKQDREPVFGSAGARHRHRRRHFTGRSRTAISSAPRRCGESVSGCSSCTTAARTNIVDAINAHGGEATRVINNFNGVSTAPDDGSNLSATESQNLVYFLRSL